jgi:hypothetical protein
MYAVMAPERGAKYDHWDGTDPLMDFYLYPEEALSED